MQARSPVQPNLHPDVKGEAATPIIKRARPKSLVSNYLYEEAEAYIQENFKDYTLIGVLPQKTVSSVWEVFPPFHFLFMKDKRYFSCSAKELLSINKKNPPVMTPAEGGYIYVKLLEENQGAYILRLRKGTEVTGHERLKVGFKELKGLAAGEIYFHQGYPVLYNHKSSYFTFPKEQVITEINGVFGTNTEPSFYGEFDAQRIAEEYEARKNKLLQDQPQLAISLPKTPTKRKVKNDTYQATNSSFFPPRKTIGEKRKNHGSIKNKSAKKPFSLARHDDKEIKERSQLSLLITI